VPALIVTDRATDWPLEIPGVEFVDSKTYLTQPQLNGRRNVRVYNLCRSYRYQSAGYYVSLLAEARGHKPVPNIVTLQDLKSQSIVRLVSDELDELIQHSLAPLQSEEFTLSVYFGRNTAKRYDRLSRQLFSMFQAPLLRFKFARQPDNTWQIRSAKTVSASEVPEGHWGFVVDAARKHFAGKAVSKSRRTHTRYDLAILHDPTELQNSPSSPKALDKFAKAGESLGLSVELITKDDSGRISEFDALFIRETTAVNHHTYRLSRRAASEGLVVIDDPESIVRCTNKVYLAELLARHKVPTPRTLVVHRDNAELISAELGFPCVLKKPDSSFSQGVVKANSPEELQDLVKQFFSESELIVAQEFLPTTFDWRIGIIDRRPFYACQYFMAPKHWQIVKQDAVGPNRYGKFETLPVETAPRKAVSAALKAANLIGDGLYGVDVKESEGRFAVIEVNDNPNLDAGIEDQILREELYRRVMQTFLDRIERRKARPVDPQ
jgi:glutathione synthase/RimK-type ligase-like ATP-grasp enzyme